MTFWSTLTNYQVFLCPSLYSVVVKEICTVQTCRCRCWSCRSCISCRSCFIVCSSKTPEWLSKQVPQIIHPSMASNEPASTDRADKIVPRLMMSRANLLVPFDTQWPTVKFSSHHLYYHDENKHRPVVVVAGAVVVVATSSVVVAASAVRCIQLTPESPKVEKKNYIDYSSPPWSTSIFRPAGITPRSSQNDNRKRRGVDSSTLRFTVPKLLNIQNMS